MTWPKNSADGANFGQYSSSWKAENRSLPRGMLSYHVYNTRMCYPVTKSHILQILDFIE